MAIRESLAYSEDFITGKRKEVIKSKSVTAPARGVFTVELFDSETGEKTYEAKSENRITAVLANPAFLDGYFYRIIDNKTNDDLYKAFNSEERGPCNILTLTDGDIAEDPYDYWIWGNVIGYANLLKGYSGSNNRRGSVNTSESSRIENYEDGTKHVIKSVTRHWVVDFPTSAANGTFKSIYLTGCGKYESGYHYYPQYTWLYNKTWLKEGTSSSSIPAQSITTDEEYLYSLKSGYTQIMIWNKRTWEAQQDKTLPESAVSLCYDKYTSTFWALHSDGSFRKYDKSFKLIKSYSKSNAMDTVEGVTMTRYRRFNDICATEQYVLYTFYADSSDSKITKTVLAVYNKDGTFVKNIVLHDSSSYRTCVFEIPNNKIKLVSSGVDIILNKDNLTVYSSNHDGSNNSQWNNGYGYCMWDFDLNLVFRYIDDSNGKIGMSWIVPAGAHTLLPEPVTKTPTNTMKIQYDLTVDFVYPLDMPTH